MFKFSFLDKKMFLWIVFILSLVLRFSLILTAHHGDLNNNISWGQIAAEKGLNGFYGSSDSDDWPYSAPNQPPLTILTFTAVAKIWQTVNLKVTDFNWRYTIFPSKFIWFWEENGWDLLIKIPSLAADVLIGYVIFDFLRKKGKKNAAVYASVWLFNPLTWYNSSVWGQTDSIVNLLGLLAVINLLDKKLVKFSFWFVLSLLFKASLGVFVPFLIYVILRQKYNIKIWLKSALVFLCVLFVVGIWFHPEWDYFFWIVNLYRERILPGEIGYLSANAFNFWWLVNPGNVLDITIFYGLPARLWGIILSVTFILLIIFKLRGKISREKIFFGLAVSSLAAFVFMTRIHPRYLYPFFPLATICLAYMPRMKFPYIALSFLHFLNIYYLFWVPDLPIIKLSYSKFVFTDSIGLGFILCLIYIYLTYPVVKHKTPSSQMYN